MKFAPALFACLFLNAAVTGQAASVLWTNLSGGNWSAATNWSPNQVPAAADHAIITNAGTYTVLVDTAATIDSLTVGGTSGRQTLSNFVSTLTLNGAGLIGTNATFAADGGSTLTGNGDLAVAGRLQWTGGVMFGAGRTIIAPGATLAVSGSGTLSGGAWLYGGYGVPLNIFNGATFDIQADTQMPWAGAGGVAVINNAGTFRKSAGAGVSAIGFVLSGGGGTSTNAQFNLTGTLGQPDAGAKLAGGSYTVEGGFWSAAVAVQMAGAPRLSVVRTGGNVIISWPSTDSDGYVVEQTGTLAVPASWSTSGATLSDDGTTKSVTLPATPGYQFFRLRKP